MERDVPIADIEVDPSTYPRKKRNDEVVEQYRQAVDRLPPIQLACLDGGGKYILVDGYHRLGALQLEGRTTVRAVVRTDLKTRREILAEAVRLNSSHGLQLSTKEKMRLAKSLYQEYTVDALAELLSVSPRTIREWTREERQLEEFRRDLRMIALYLSGKTEAEIAAEVQGFSDHSSVSRRLSYYLSEGRLAEFHRILLSEPRDRLEEAKREAVEEILGDHLLDPYAPPASFQEYSVWHFEGCDDRYGSDYPGRLAGQIVENLLWSYTETFGKVYDPFAGSGTTVDVCRAHFRRCWASDISPYAKDKGVFQHDITRGYPRFPKGYKMDLVILDPPYWRQRRGDYGPEPTNLANLPLDRFYAEMEKVIAGAVEVLADGGRVALIIGSTVADGKEFDHAFELYRRALKYLSFERRFIVPYSKWQYQAHDVVRARETGVRLNLHRDLIVFRKA